MFKTVAFCDANTVVQALGSIVRPILGTNKSVKCIVDDDRPSFVHDVALLLQQLDIQHPIGQYISDVCEAHHRNYGTGCKTLLVMVMCFMKAAIFLHDQGLNWTIIDGLMQRVIQECINRATEEVIPIELHGKNRFQCLKFGRLGDEFLRKDNVKNLHTQEEQMSHHIAEDLDYMSALKAECKSCVPLVSSASKHKTRKEKRSSGKLESFGYSKEFKPQVSADGHPCSEPKSNTLELSTTKSEMEQSVEHLFLDFGSPGQDYSEIPGANYVYLKMKAAKSVEHSDENDISWFFSEVGSGKETWQEDGFSNVEHADKKEMTQFFSKDGNGSGTLQENRFSDIDLISMETKSLHVNGDRPKLNLLEDGKASGVFDHVKHRSWTSKPNFCCESESDSEFDDCFNDLHRTDKNEISTNIQLNDKVNFYMSNNRDPKSKVTNDLRHAADYNVTAEPAEESQKGNFDIEAKKKKERESTSAAGTTSAGNDDDDNDEFADCFNVPDCGNSPCEKDGNENCNFLSNSEYVKEDETNQSFSETATFGKGFLDNTTLNGERKNSHEETVPKIVCGKMNGNQERAFELTDLDKMLDLVKQKSESQKLVTPGKVQNSSRHFKTAESSVRNFEVNHLTELPSDSYVCLNKSSNESDQIQQNRKKSPPKQMKSKTFVRDQDMKKVSLSQGLSGKSDSDIPLKLGVGSNKGQGKTTLNNLFRSSRHFTPELKSGVQELETCQREVTGGRPSMGQGDNIHSAEYAGFGNQGKQESCAEMLSGFEARMQALFSQRFEVTRKPSVSLLNLKNCSRHFKTFETSELVHVGNKHSQEMNQTFTNKISQSGNIESNGHRKELSLLNETFLVRKLNEEKHLLNSEIVGNPTCSNCTDEKAVSGCGMNSCLVHQMPACSTGLAQTAFCERNSPRALASERKTQCAHSLNVDGTFRSPYFDPNHDIQCDVCTTKADNTCATSDEEKSNHTKKGDNSGQMSDLKQTTAKSGTNSEIAKYLHLIVKGLSHGADKDLVDTVTSTIVHQLKNQYVSGSALCYDVRLIHCCIQSHCIPGSLELVDGLVLSVYVDQMTTVTSLAGRTCRALLINGDVRPGFTHTGYKKPIQSMEVIQADSYSSHMTKTDHWLKHVAEVLAELNVDIIVCRGPVCEEVKCHCQSNGIVVMEMVPYKALLALATSAGVDMTIYITDATEINVCDKVGMIPRHKDWMDKPVPASGTCEIKLSLLTGVIQTVVIRQPASSLADIKEQEFWQCAKRVSSALKYGGILPGCAETEAHYSQYCRQKAGEIRRDGLHEDEFYPVVLEAIADAFLQYSHIVHQNSKSWESFSEDNPADSVSCEDYHLDERNKECVFKSDEYRDNSASHSSRLKYLSHSTVSEHLSGAIRLEHLSRHGDEIDDHTMRGTFAVNHCRQCGQSYASNTDTLYSSNTLDHSLPPVHKNSVLGNSEDAVISNMTNTVCFDDPRSKFAAWRTALDTVSNILHTDTYIITGLTGQSGSHIIL